VRPAGDGLLRRATATRGTVCGMLPGERGAAPWRLPAVSVGDGWRLAAPHER